MSPAVRASGPPPDAARPLPSPVHDILADLHDAFRTLRDGEVATYIPELAKADPDWFGICLATPDGQVYEVGDTAVPFTIQSVSKPFVYAAALARHGPEAVARKVGVEPSGDAFNAISLDPVSGRPANPMINAGAIATTALLPGDGPDGRGAYMRETLSAFAGRPLAVNEDVYASERDTGFRNRAIAFMLRSAGVLESDPVAAADVYFRQCSVEVTCRDLAVMAAVLASGGVSPVTGARVLAPGCVTRVLSVMATCGMYNFAGEWTFDVGLPAKSGVSGGLLAVLPGRLGIAVFAPPLDPLGNSVRGVAVCRALSRRLGLHLFGSPAGARTVIHRRLSGAEITSNRVRPSAEYARLARQGARIGVYGLQGDITFSTAEVVVREVASVPGDGRFLIVDLDRVTALDGPACALLAGLARALSARGCRLLFSGVTADFAGALGAAGLDGPWAPDVDRALEWCEDALLAGPDGAPPGAAGPAGLERFALLAGLTAEELGLVEAAVEERRFAAGEPIVQAGAADRRVFLLARGEASALLAAGAGRETRLATFSPGTSFGEMALLGRPRSATVRADGPVTCFVLDVERLARLWSARPRIKAVLMENLAADLGEKLRRTNETVRALAP